MGGVWGAVVVVPELCGAVQEKSHARKKRGAYEDVAEYGVAALGSIATKGGRGLSPGWAPRGCSGGPRSAGGGARDSGSLQRTGKWAVGIAGMGGESD